MWELSEFSNFWRSLKYLFIFIRSVAASEGVSPPSFFSDESHHELVKFVRFVKNTIFGFLDCIYYAYAISVISTLMLTCLNVSGAFAVLFVPPCKFSAFFLHAHPFLSADSAVSYKF